MLEHVQYSSRPEPVTRFLHPDGTAEFRLTKDVTVHEDDDGNTIIEADEVYFEVPGSQQIPSVADVEAEFDQYWENGINWPAYAPPPPTIEELQEQVTAQDQKIAMLVDCLLEMSEIVYE